MNFNIPHINRVQSIIFRRGIWSIPQAEQWLRGHDYFPIKPVDITTNYYRFRLEEPEPNADYRLIPFGKNTGIKAVYMIETGKRVLNRKRIQAEQLALLHKPRRFAKPHLPPLAFPIETPTLAPFSPPPPSPTGSPIKSSLKPRKIKYKPKKKSRAVRSSLILERVYKYLNENCPGSKFTKLSAKRTRKPKKRKAAKKPAKPRKPRKSRLQGNLGIAGFPIDYEREEIRKWIKKNKFFG